MTTENSHVLQQGSGMANITDYFCAADSKFDLRLNVVKGQCSFTSTTFIMDYS